MSHLRLAESAHKCVQPLYLQIVSSTDEGVKKMARTIKQKEKLLNRIRREELTDIVNRYLRQMESAPRGFLLTPPASLIPQLFKIEQTRWSAGIKVNKEK